MSLSHFSRLHRSAAPMMLAFLLASTGSLFATQVAPTLPSDTLRGRKLPPEANVPRTVVAPTLPRDTLASPVAGGADSITPPVPTAARLPGSSDTTGATDSTAVRDSTTARDSTLMRAPQTRPVPRPAAPRRQERLHPAAAPRLTLA